MQQQDIAALSFHGEGLQRPECVLATRSGDLVMSDRQGIAIIAPNGATTRIPARNAPEHFLPNGIALMPDRSVLIADLGLGGGVWRMAPGGALTPFLLEVDGARLHPTNFVGLDRAGRIWITVSTRLVPREQSMRRGFGDGYIILVDQAGPRIVAEGLGFTNEAIPDPAGEYLYVNETQARRISRLKILPTGLGPRETVCEFPEGVWPDGMAHDAEGGVWVVSVISNRILRVDTKTGKAELFLEDADTNDLAIAEASWQSGEITPRPLLDAGGKRLLGNASSLAFGGPDLRTLYIGTLFGTRIASIPAPVRGATPVQWEF